MEDVYQNSINPGFYDISMKRANAAGGNVPDPPDFELQPGLYNRVFMYDIVSPDMNCSPQKPCSAFFFSKRAQSRQNTQNCDLSAEIARIRLVEYRFKFLDRSDHSSLSIEPSQLGGIEISDNFPL